MNEQVSQGVLKQESNNHQEADVLENFSPRVYQTPGLQG
jgi:hypothetical protein